MKKTFDDRILQISDTFKVCCGLKRRHCYKFVSVKEFQNRSAFGKLPWHLFSLTPANTLTFTARRSASAVYAVVVYVRPFVTSRHCVNSQT